MLFFTYAVLLIIIPFFLFERFSSFIKEYAKSLGTIYNSLFEYNITAMS